MRSEAEWRALLERQGTALQEASDNLIRSREEGTDVEEARAEFVEALHLYRANLEAAPLRVVAWVAFSSSKPFRN